MKTTYDRIEHSFIIEDKEGNESKIKFGYQDHCKTNNFENEVIDDYSFNIYYKHNISESACKNVFVKEKSSPGRKRIGWLIPFSALITTDEDLKKNPHLSCYVFLAYEHLLMQEKFSGCSNYNEFEDIINEEEYTNACIFITNKNKYDELERLKFSLAANGYYEKDIKYVNPFSPCLEEIVILHPTQIIADVDSAYCDPYFEEYLNIHSIETNQVYKFLYLYQIIETLFEKILIVNLEKLLDEVKSRNGTVRCIDDELKKNTELDRWKDIEARACMNETLFKDLPQLVNLCKKYLGYEEDSKLKHPEAMYQVRNHITHRFRKAMLRPDDLKEINDLFELYLLKILINFDEKKN